eukprot:TRINITY_DN2021_c5_g1_i1.p1 TRINITY_DN2021_c5_g1~~TRINITY_DN2021_c5_g1_i1.p1  ORF type:complete len:146 (+),score=20.62 TRINITY_DN2021_c5_g1_i1:65-502(+)
MQWHLTIVFLKKPALMSSFAHERVICEFLFDILFVFVKSCICSLQLVVNSQVLPPRNFSDPLPVLSLLSLFYGQRVLLPPNRKRKRKRKKATKSKITVTEEDVHGDNIYSQHLRFQYESDEMVESEIMKEQTENFKKKRRRKEGY